MIFLKHLIFFDVESSNTHFMGKGDIKSKRGKIVNGSFGKRRPHRVKSSGAVKNEKVTEKSAE